MTRPFFFRNKSSSVKEPPTHEQSNELFAIGYERKKILRKRRRRRKRSRETPGLLKRALDNWSMERLCERERKVGGGL